MLSLLVGEVVPLKGEKKMSDKANCNGEKNLIELGVYDAMNGCDFSASWHERFARLVRDVRRAQKAGSKAYLYGEDVDEASDKEYELFEDLFNLLCERKTLKKGYSIIKDCPTCEHQKLKEKKEEAPQNPPQTRTQELTYELVKLHRRFDSFLKIAIDMDLVGQHRVELRCIKDELDNIIHQFYVDHEKTTEERENRKEVVASKPKAKEIREEMAAVLSDLTLIDLEMAQSKSAQLLVRDKASKRLMELEVLLDMALDEG